MEAEVPDIFTYEDTTELDDDCSDADTAAGQNKTTEAK